MIERPTQEGYWWVNTAETSRAEDWEIVFVKAENDGRFGYYKTGFRARFQVEEHSQWIGPLLRGVDLIRAERERQISGEGWTAEHDDQHDPGELAVAGMCYAAYAGNALHPYTQGDGDWNEQPPEWWPWEANWWKPDADPIRNLVKAGALISAEIDRLLRSS